LKKGEKSRKALTALFIIAYVLLKALKIEAVSVIGFVAGALLVIEASEVAVEALRDMALHMGRSHYFAGIISSAASNLPELAIAITMCRRGVITGNEEIFEVGVLSVVIAAGFNTLLLGILIVALTRKGGYIKFPYKAIQHESELIRMTIVVCTLIFAIGVIEEETGVLPREAGVFMLTIYLVYLFFIVETQKEETEEKPRRGVYRVMLELIISFALIVVGGELITKSSEGFIEHLSIAATALIIGGLGSIPEHGIALIGGKKGLTELSVANLLSGVVQSVLVVFGVIATIFPVTLDGYMMFQLISIACALWIVKKAILDDEKLSLDEGLFIVILQLMLFTLLDKLRT